MHAPAPAQCPPSSLDTWFLVRSSICSTRVTATAAIPAPNSTCTIKTYHHRNTSMPEPARDCATNVCTSPALLYPYLQTVGHAGSRHSARLHPLACFPLVSPLNHNLYDASARTSTCPVPSLQPGHVIPGAMRLLSQPVLLYDIGCTTHTIVSQPSCTSSISLLATLAMSTSADREIPTGRTVQRFHSCSFPMRIIHVPPAKQRLHDTVLPPLS